MLATVDVVTTLPSGQVLALTRIMPDFAVRGRSERSSARLRRPKQTLRDGKESKTHLPLLHTTLPYHSEMINKKFYLPVYCNVGVPLLLIK